jgi:hypothetical protein
VNKKTPPRKNSAAKAVPGRTNRKVAIFVSLFGMVAFTSLLLVVLAPPPLTTAMWKSLFAVDSPDSLDGVFATDVPVSPTRWNWIYIHHSKTADGDAVSLAHDDGLCDHFVIGNGGGCVDGEIQMTQTWNRQESITHPPAGVSIKPGCISICVVGDFDSTRPTPTQQRRLLQLVGTLQTKFHIPAQQVSLYDQPGTVAEIGHSFPVAAFRSQILP